VFNDVTEVSSFFESLHEAAAPPEAALVIV
jgi:hypothetical protein